MKANEFVKKVGWERAKHCKKPSSRDNFFIVGGEVIRDQDLIELKRLVESYELVKVWQLPEDDNDETGVDGARMYLECYAFYSTDEEKAKLDRLEQAIADVESCNA